MTDWNPNAAESVGLEWFPTEWGERILNAPGKAAAIRFRSRSGPTPINSVGLAIPKTSRRRVNSARWLVEVFVAGNEVPGAVSTFTCGPDGLAANVGNAWKIATGTVVSTDAHIINSIGTADFSASDYVQYAGTYANKSGLFLEFNAGSWGASQRVVGGRLNLVANRADASGRLQVYYRPPTGGNFAIGEITVDTETREFSIPWPEMNPATNLPWTRSDIQLLATTARIRIKPIGIGRNKPLRVYWMSLDLDYVTENRVAVGRLGGFAAGAWTQALLSHPTTGADNWSKANNTTYTVMCRRIPRWRSVGASTELESAVLEGGTVGWRWLGESATVADELGRDPWLPDPYMESFSPLLNGDGTVAEMGVPGARGYGVSLEQDPATTSADGQPYGTFLYTYGSSPLDGLRYQDFTAPANASYDVVTGLVARPEGADGTLTIAVVDNSAVVLDSVVLTSSEVDALPVIGVVADGPDVESISAAYLGQSWRMFQVPVDVTLTAAAKYRIVITESNDEAITPVLVAGGLGPSAGAPTFDGVNGRWDSFDGMDAPFTLATRPAAPANFATAIGTQTLITDTQPLTPDWLIRDMEYVSVTWTSTSLVADFVRYEIQRSQDAGATWESIAWITEEAVQEFRDYEGLRNVAASYRMRVVASWDAASAWTATQVETPAMADCALLFVSNEDPSINQGYVDVGGERKWTFQSGDERETHILVGRNYQVVTSPLEYRGDRFEVELAAWAGSTPADTGRAHFDKVESLNSAATSYICVLDEQGRRWLADVAVTEGTRRGTKVHVVQADVIEVSDVPSLVDVESGAWA